ncbi:MAG: hypothetical protein HQL56_01915 [Magnetococcales bacterium]|nr:hypothetical protein [Magnetococcales bacterium]
MAVLNFIPLGLLAFVVYKAFRQGRTWDYTDRYFQENRHRTGLKFCNWFGIPKP